jgi:hypothetical protein
MEHQQQQIDYRQEGPTTRGITIHLSSCYFPLHMHTHSLMSHYVVWRRTPQI